MAVVTGPALSLDASGNLGAICYSSWRGMNIARGVWTGTDPNTGLQQAMRAITKAVAQAWGGTLTSTERDAWNAAASNQKMMSRLKTLYVPTGYHYYNKLNIQRLRLGGALMKTPPEAIDPYTFTNFRLGYNYYDEDVNLHFEDPIGSGIAEMSAEVWRAGPYDSGGRRAIDGEYRFLKFIQPIASDTDSGLTVGKYYWYRARVIDDYGRTQNWFDAQILIPTKESGQILLNSAFTAWTADDPDDWAVTGEDADNKVTELVNGASMTGIATGQLSIKQDFAVEAEKPYKLVISNTRTVGESAVQVRDTPTDYVPFERIVVDSYEADFTGLIGYLSPHITIYKITADAMDIILHHVKIYKLD